MYSISNKINIIRQAKVSNAVFRNDEIAEKVVTQFECCNCQGTNIIEIIPYESGFPILQIYSEDKVLTKSELLENKMLTETSSWMGHYGELTFNNLPTLYFGIDCAICETKYIGVFCFGEKQPGLTLLELSGVWQYSEADNVLKV